ncbi:uncharacterized protein LOC141900119 [Tubulanus polymorphus]|uniref:uncharacterized protein LOC141900119 n=1 Tax=Tubulanus polymorphus TaxID=672921 RepID=UPI003DA5920C
MGSMCSICLKSEGKYSNVDDRYAANERTSLLGSDSSKPVVTSPPKSARHNSYLTTANEEEPTVTYEPIAIQRVGLEDIDKPFMDHANLYNEYVVKWKNLNDLINKIQDAFPNSNPSISATLRILKMKLEGAEITVKRKYQFCIELNYDKREIPEELLPVLDHYNSANHLTKDILDKGPMLLQSVDIILKNEQRGKRDILVYSAEEENKSKGPEMLKIYMNNYMEVKKIPPNLAVIKKKCIAYFDDLKNSAQYLLINEDLKV